VAPAIKLLALHNGLSGSISKDLVAPPLRNIQRRADCGEDISICSQHEFDSKLRYRRYNVSAVIAEKSAEDNFLHAVGGSRVSPCVSLFVREHVQPAPLQGRSPPTGYHNARCAAH